MPNLFRHLTSKTNNFANGVLKRVLHDGFLVTRILANCLELHEF